MSNRYKQKVPREKVKRMIQRGWKVRLSTEWVPSRAVQNGDIWNCDAYKNKVGYILIDPDGYPVSPEPRDKASQAWDDIIGGNSDDSA